MSLDFTHMPDYTPHQKKIIERYYDNRDQIMLERLGEIATDLYLAESPGARKRLWARAAKAMKALKVKPALMEHILAQEKPEILATNLRGWLDSGKKRG
jgi:hypothetical protein